MTWNVIILKIQKWIKSVLPLLCTIMLSEHCILVDWSVYFLEGWWQFNEMLHDSKSRPLLWNTVVLSAQHNGNLKYMDASALLSIWGYLSKFIVT